jgi:hypothetical protein
VDLCIITKEGVEYLRNYEFLQAKTYSRKFPVTYPPGTAREWGTWGVCVWGERRRRRGEGGCFAALQVCSNVQGLTLAA